MSVRSAVPTFTELMQFAKSSQDVEFHTLFQEKPFQVFVMDDKLLFRPSGSVERPAQTTRVNEVLAKLKATGSWKPSDYAGDSHNASYLLSLIKAWQSARPGDRLTSPAELVHAALNNEQKEELKDAVRAAVRYRDCKLRDDLLKHGFQVDLRATRKKPWIGSIYWSENNPGNEVEIAFDPPRLARTNAEAVTLTRWFQTTAREMQNCLPRNHSGDNPDWFRAGFRFADALVFFGQLAKRTDPFTPERNRWGLNITPAPSPTPESAPALKTEPKAAPRLEEESMNHMLAMAKQACNQSGEVRSTVAKTKDFKFQDDAEFLSYVSDLLVKQQNRCAITNLQLQFVGNCEDEERLASLDRIDSNGHYARDNLQVVCRFVNRWKSDDADQNFRRLIGLLRQ